MKQRMNITAIALALLLSLLLAACSAKKPDYSFALTDEQEQTVQSVTSHLIRREGENEYYVQYADCGAELKRGRLTTLYDGMGVALIRPGEDPIFPVCNLNGGQGDALNCTGTAVLQKEGETEGWRGLIRVDRETNKPTLVSMALREESTDEQLLAGEYGQLQEISDYDSAIFLAGMIYRITYGEDGKLLPISSWEQTTGLIAYEIAFDGSAEMNYMPLVGGEYYILYEITDADGNVYCSDLIPYATERIPPREDKREPEISVKWEKGTREQLLFSKNGIDVYLAVVKDFDGMNSYAIKARNNTDRAVSVVGTDGFINGNVYCSCYGSVRVDPGKFVAESNGFSFGVADSAPETQAIESFQLTVYAEDDETWAQVMEKTVVRVDMTDAWRMDREYTGSFEIMEPGMDALAQEQVLLEDEEVRLTLVNGGAVGTDTETLRLVFKAENLTPYEQQVDIKGLAVNNVYIDGSYTESLPGNSVVYWHEDITDYELQDATDLSVQSLAVLVTRPGNEAWKVPSTQKQWVPITLTRSGRAAPFEKGDVLWAQDSMEVGSRGYDPKKDLWLLTLVNQSDQAVRLQVVEAATGEKLWPGAAKAYPGQNAVVEVSNPADWTDTGEVAPYAIRLQIYDLETGELLAESPEEIILA